uniref:V-set and transmembrane domain-containing protein 1-like isoform X5 n=1 Tax=Halichoerus grypus TaxID=9711 RepID=UPI001658E36B|nr:V-set and transmembrane domain-containing protein 1-like isoform X5 [Halichoerus grypus]
MMPQLLALLCTGLCVGQGSRTTDESLPKPSLRAWPSSVLPCKSNVTLQCQTSTKNVNFVFRKGKVPLQPVKSRASTEGLAEFHLTDLKTDNAGQYTCEYYRLGSPYISSQPSDVLLLLVTGKTERKSPKMAETELGTTGITLFVIFIFLFLLGTFLIWKYTRCGAAPDKMTKRSHSKEPEEVGPSIQPEKESGDPPAAMTSCSPASDKTSQVSRAEEPYGVTYAELNTRALSEGPSSQMEQPLETCVYSTLKA